METVCAACCEPGRAISSISGLCKECEEELGADTRDETLASAEARDPISITLTTESAGNFAIQSRHGIVSARAVIGQNIFKDIASGFRDFFGGRSKVMQNGFRDAEAVVLQELESEAVARGANAVIGLQVQYSSVAGVGTSNMLLISAVGTAVRLRG